jgi:hypothetical protein
VKMVAQISGTRDGKDWPKPGEDLECSTAEADDLVRAGLAVKPGDEDENALADVLPVETATRSRKGQKAVASDARLAMKPAPHADEEDAYHVPVLPGEKAAAKAGQKQVDDINKDMGVDVEAHKDVRGDPK